MVKLGREEPVASMDSSGKIIWARHNEIQTVNVKSTGDTDEVRARWGVKRTLRPTSSLLKLAGGTDSLCAVQRCAVLRQPTVRPAGPAAGLCF
jgi:hypothetical protein